jgi:hypothetical protein
LIHMHRSAREMPRLPDASSTYLEGFLFRPN